MYIPIDCRAENICSPFRVHNVAVLPEAPHLSNPSVLPLHWEKELPQKIGKVKTQELFPQFYESWLEHHRWEMSDSDRFKWLECLLFYVSKDTNHNGIPDWSAIADERPARVLYPQDPDQDGDGVENIWDPQPLDKNIKSFRSLSEVPSHLKLQNSKAQKVQELLYKKFGILAVDHTDQHAEMVLKILLDLFERGLKPHFLGQLKSLKYIYAFSGHDPQWNVAAFHQQAQSLSIGGELVYAHRLFSLNEQIHLMQTLAHEIGHAVIFDRLDAFQLADAAEKYGGWNPIPSFALKRSFFSPALLDSQESFAKSRNIISQYSKTNRHEWFAEVFAYRIMSHMNLSRGKATFLKVQPKMYAPQKYAQKRTLELTLDLSEDLTHWLDQLMSRPPPTGHLFFRLGKNGGRVSLNK